MSDDEIDIFHASNDNVEYAEELNKKRKSDSKNRQAKFPQKKVKMIRDKMLASPHYSCNFDQFVEKISDESHLN